MPPSLCFVVFVTLWSELFSFVGPYLIIIFSHINKVLAYPKAKKKKKKKEEDASEIGDNSTKFRF